MRGRSRASIDPVEATYIELLLRDRDPASKKVGLQRLCRLYRSGQRLRNPEPVITTIVGLLHDEDSKVRRWALICLALLGNSRQSVAIVETISRKRNDPDMVGSGISALSSLLEPDEVRRLLAAQDLPLEGLALLAAAQHNETFRKQLNAFYLDIDAADPAELRFAMLLVGLGKAHENLLSKNHGNADVIGELNLHPDSLVAQYSVWATCEDPSMGVENLRLRLADIERYPPNVRAWVYKLITSDSTTALKYRDYIVVGSEDVLVEAREGLAEGLKGVFFDSLDEIVFDWFVDEENSTVRQRLLEHMASNADRCPTYQKAVIESYKDASSGSLLRARLESAARGTDLQLELRKIALAIDNPDLFVPANPVFQIDRQRASSKERERDDACDPVGRDGSVGDPVMRPKILIVTALPKEAAAVKATFDSRDVIGIKVDPNVYELGTYQVRDRAISVLLASSGMGKANASTLASNALRSFPSVEHIIMVGIAGGCPNPENPSEHVRLGDIVVSDVTGIIEYDFVKETEGKQETRSSPQKPSAKLLNVLSHLQSEELREGVMHLGS